MTPEERDLIIKQINDGFAGVRADYEILKTTSVTNEEFKAKVEEIDKKHAELEETLKALTKPADIKPLGGVTENGDPKCGFKSFADYSNALVHASKGPVDPRLLEVATIEAAAIRKAAGTGMNLTDNEFGGYLVPEEYRRGILKVALDTSDIISKATIIPMAVPALNIPALDFYDRSAGIYGGISYYWIGENDAITESRPKFEMLSLRLKKLAGMAYASSEQIQYSPMSVETMLRQMFGEGIAYTLDDVFLNGTGSAQPLGIANAGCTYSVAIESGQTLAGDPIDFKNIVKMNGKMWRKTNAGWYMNPDVAEQLPFMEIVVGSGGAPVFLPASGINVGGYNTLYGRPITEMDQCQALGTVGDINFCDWSQYLIGVPQGLGMNTRFDTSIHLKFDYDQIAFRFIIQVEGMPWWRTYQTPKRGTTYRTPFVTLAARS